MIFARSKDDKWLVLKRHKQPYIFMLGAMSGKIHLGETIQQAATRECNDYINSSENLQYRGFVSVRISDDEDLITHITGPVWFLDNLDIKWTEKLNRHGLLQWVNWKEIDYKEFIPGWKEIVEKIETNEKFMLDLSFTL